jgi:branched-chain amino acid transport system substrate-binding protein
MKSGTFDVDMYVWFRWRGHIAEAATASPEEQLPWELANGAINTSVLNSVERLGGWTYLCYRVGATMRGQFLLHEYPFDTQTLTISIESGDHASDEVVFVAEDVDLSGRRRDLMRHALSPRVTISDWKIGSVAQRAESYFYDHDFGSPEMAAQGVLSFPRFSFTIEIRRVLFPYLVKFCLPLVIIVMMSFLVFFIRPEEFEVQAGIVITALLSVVAFHVSQADSLPEVGYLVTADKFFMLSYVVIFLTLVEVVIENRLLHSRGEQAARRLDHLARVAFPIVFFGPIAYMIASRL